MPLVPETRSRLPAEGPDLAGADKTFSDVPEARAGSDAGGFNAPVATELTLLTS